MAKFTPQEVSALQGGGNASAREIYLKEWDPQRNSLPDGRARNLAERLIVASSNQLVLVPCNVGEHWLLTIIQPHKGLVVYLMDPISHRHRDATWKSIVHTSTRYSIEREPTTLEVRVAGKTWSRRFIKVL